MMSVIRFGGFCVLLFSVTMVWADEVPNASAPFVHPGLLHSGEEIAFFRVKVERGEQPWKDAFDRLQSSHLASLNHQPKPSTKVVRGPYNNPDIGSSELSADCSAAYLHALQWCLTGDPAYAEKAIEILNAWSSTLEMVGGHDTKLLIGMMGVKFCNAAELIRHTEAGWQADEQVRFEKMLRDVFYPEIKDFYPSANGNWDASMIQTMIAIGIFLDDREIFDRGVDYYLHGEGNGAVRNYFNEFGQCQESGRDQNHAQMGIGFLGCACEMAWKQGVDLYSAYDNRLALGFEYTAKYNLGEDVPYETYRSVDGRYKYRRLSDEARGRLAPIYQRAVNHYRDRVGIAMPYSEKAAVKTRTKTRSGAHVGWGNLTAIGMPNVVTATAIKP